MKKAKLYFYFYKNYGFFWFPRIYKHGLLWKHKFGTPRVEALPTFQFDWLWFGFRVDKGSDQYWEQYLWIEKYCGGDIVKAEDTWGWKNLNGVSTWKHY